jgi:hypothetical protein
MKKCIIFFLIALMAVLPIQSNEIHRAMQDKHDEIVPRHMPVLEKQRELITKLSPTWYELFFADKERDLLRQSPETRQFLHDFSIENAQVLGIVVCKECLDAIPDPDVLDVGVCYGKFLESRDHEEQRWIATHNDKARGYDRVCESGIDEGSRQLREWILTTIGENSKE